MNVTINLRNVQEQFGENSEQVRKVAHKAALAYAGLWAMAYERGESLEAVISQALEARVGGCE